MWVPAGWIPAGNRFCAAPNGMVSRASFLNGGFRLDVVGTRYREKKERGSETAVSDNPLFEQVAAVAEDSHLTLDVGV